MALKKIKIPLKQKVSLMWQAMKTNKLIEGHQFDEGPYVSQGKCPPWSEYHALRAELDALAKHFGVEKHYNYVDKYSFKPIAQKKKK